MDMHEIICREAKISDQKFIDDLSKGMYSGADYTPKMFSSWLCDENWQPFVAEVSSSGDVVGFLALHIIDNKTKVIIRSSRVAEEYRDKRVYSRLLYYSFVTVKEKFSSINFVVSVQRPGLKTPLGYVVEHDFTFQLIRCGINPSNESTEPKDQPDDELASLVINRESFSNLYEMKRSMMQELFSGNVVYIGQEMYRLDLKENRTFLDKQNHLVASYSEDEDYKVISIVDLFERESIDGYKVYYVDLYGNNSAVILRHALKAISMASEQAGGKVFDIYIQMHSKEAEAIFCHFLNRKNYQVVRRDGHLKITAAEIDVVIFNMHKKFSKNG
eukprot:gene17586-19339_t